MTLVAAHQPDLLPYTGFWYKMAKADVLVLLPFDQFQKHGYQRRVKMREAWCSHQLVGKPSLVPISSVQVHPGWAARLVDVIEGRYSGARYWKTRGPELCNEITRLGLSLTDPEPPSSLVWVNSRLLRLMRERLGITTRVEIADPELASSGAQRVLDHVRQVEGTAYLSGTGAQAYMPDAEEMFARAGVELVWSRHRHRSGDSILTAYFDEADPMDAIMEEYE